MVERNGGENNATLIVRSGRDAALADALERLAPGRRPELAGFAGSACHRDAAAAGGICRGTRLFLRRSIAACGMRSARAESRSSTRIRPKRSTHALAGRNVVVITPTASGKTLCYNAPVLNADAPGSVEPRAVSVSNQGARPGSARRAAGDVRNACRRRRRQGSACSPTTATRRRMRGGRFGRARTSCSAIPTWCTRASCRTIRAGRSCSRICATSSSTNCTPTAVCSAVICATCCGGCGGSAGTTDRIRCSSARQRRSPIRASWPNGSPSSPSSSSTGAARRAARSSSSSSTRRSSTISSASGGRTLPRRDGWPRSS